MTSTKTTNWVIAGLSVAAVATAAYIAYRQFYADAAAGSGKANTTLKKSVSQGQKKKKKRPLPSNSSSSAAVASMATAEDVQVDQTAAALANLKTSEEKISERPKEKAKSNKKKVDCDSPLEEILAQSPEVKQQLFMEMMMRGEFFIQQGIHDRAIEYLVKGLGMIPNPGEVLLAFEQTLPEPIFKSLLERLQKEGRKRVKQYFDAIHAEHSEISFASKESKNEMTGHSAERWYMQAAQDFSAGQTIFSEPADLISVTINHFDESSIDGLKYVGDSEESKEAFMELLKHCKDNNSSAGLLLFKYISLLLDAELENNAAGISASGPFAHYDHLRPAFRQPTALDLKEAKLLRAIFTRSNPNMQDFLTDDIYAAMKYTMLFNCYGFKSTDATDEESESDTIKECTEIVRNVMSTAEAKWIGLYHIASHIDHSCKPNATIEMNEADQTVTVKALTDIQSSQPITVSYLPGLDCIDKDARQISLLSKFGIVCECTACQQQ